MNHIRKDHPLPHMISRREFIKNSGLGIAAVALSACTGNKVVQSTANVPSNTAVSSSPTPVSGQTLTIGLATGPVGMDPDFHGGREGHTIHRNCSAAPLMFPPLSIGANYQSDFNKLNGDLAQEWKVNSDWSGITVTLKQGIMSSAGNELTADDVIYKFQRSEALKGIGWGLNSLALQITHANEVTKDGKYTFTVHGEKPSVLMEMFQTHDMSVLYDTTEMQKHKTADDPWATKWAASNWVGYGPYQVTEWVAGDRLVFERNKNYFNPKAITGNIDKIVFREIPESSNALALLQSGDIDIAYDLAGDQRQKIGAISGFKIDKTPGNFLQWLQFPFATTTNPQLLDLNVRQAIVNAIPYKDILDRAYLGYATQMICALAPIYPGYDVVSKAVGAKIQDLNKAKDFLSKSQYASGFDTTINYDASIAEQEQIGVLIKAALAEIGINVTLIKQQDSDFVAQAFGSTGFPGMCLFMDMVGLPSPAFTTFLYFLKGHCCAPGSFQDTDINNLYAQQIASIGDVNKQIQLQAQIEDIAWNKDPTGAPLAYPGFQLSLQNKVSGWWWMSLDEIIYQKAIKA